MDEFNQTRPLRNITKQKTYLAQQVTQRTGWIMPAPRNYLLAALSLTTLAGCDAINDWYAIEMVQRNMDNMVFVEGGEFLMGNPGGWAMGADTVPAHEVVLDDFYIQKYEVTQGDFEVFVEASGYVVQGRRYEKKKELSPNRFAEDLPAAVSWVDAKAFCVWLGQQSNRNVDLPTEAQWEYAARSRGKQVRHATDNGALDPGRNISNVNAPTSAQHNKERDLPEPPGHYPPNPIGLYDMSANVSEWVNDYYQPDYYRHSAKVNPKGPDTSEQNSLFNEPSMVIRGANFQGSIINSSSVVRLRETQLSVALDVGFRCAAN